MPIFRQLIQYQQTTLLLRPQVAGKPAMYAGILQELFASGTALLVLQSTSQATVDVKGPASATLVLQSTAQAQAALAAGASATFTLQSTAQAQAALAASAAATLTMQSTSQAQAAIAGAANALFVLQSTSQASAAIAASGTALLIVQGTGSSTVAITGGASMTLVLQGLSTAIVTFPELFATASATLFIGSIATAQAAIAAQAIGLLVLLTDLAGGIHVNPGIRGIVINPSQHLGSLAAFGAAVLGLSTVQTAMGGAAVVTTNIGSTGVPATDRSGDVLVGTTPRTGSPTVYSEVA